MRFPLLLSKASKFANAVSEKFSLGILMERLMMSSCDSMGADSSMMCSSVDCAIASIPVICVPSSCGISSASFSLPSVRTSPSDCSAMNPAASIAVHSLLNSLNFPISKVSHQNPQPKILLVAFPKGFAPYDWPANIRPNLLLPAQYLTVPASHSVRFASLFFCDFFPQGWHSRSVLYLASPSSSALHPVQFQPILPIPLLRSELSYLHPQQF